MPYLPSFKSPTSVQEEPFQVSAAAELPDGFGAPPKAIADVVVPVAPGPNLPAFKSPTSVQLDPSHDSTIACAPGSPAIAKAAVFVPALPK